MKIYDLIQNKNNIGQTSMTDINQRKTIAMQVHAFGQAHSQRDGVTHVSWELNSTMRRWCTQQNIRTNSKNQFKLIYQNPRQTAKVVLILVTFCEVDYIYTRELADVHCLWVIDNPDVSLEFTLSALECAIVTFTLASW